MTEGKVCADETVGAREEGSGSAHETGEARRNDRREIPHSADSVRNDGAEFRSAVEKAHADANVAGGSKQRRSGRVSEQVAVVIVGADGEGRVLAEETHTVVVSRHGAGIVSRHKLMPEQELILRAVELQREAEVCVVGEIGRQGAVYTYGLAFLDEALDF